MLSGAMPERFENGAVAMIDALGFRGIWQRFDAEKVVTLLNRLRTESAGLTGDLRVHIFSDMVVVGACPSPNLPEMHNVLREVLRGVERLWHSAVTGDPPLLFRGCIATGRIVTTEHVVVGEAVDEAAAMMEAADCAAVWLTPGADERWMDWGFARDVLTFPYAVPLRDGRVIRTRALNPLAHVAATAGGFGAGEAEFSHFRCTVANAFRVHSHGSMATDVAIKKQNTDALPATAWEYLREIDRREHEKMAVTEPLTAESFDNMD
jgi:hypothetical protein